MVKVIRSGDIKTKKIVFKEADLYMGLAEPADKSTIPMSVGIIKHIAGGRPVEGVTQWNEVTIITEGTLEAIVDGQKIICNKGDIVLTPKGTKVSMIAPSGCEAIFVMYPHFEEASKGTPLEGMF